METNLKKLLTILGIATFSASSAFAATYDNDQDKEGPAKSAVPPAKNQSGEDGPSVMISADYTLWTARQYGLAYAESNFYSPATTTPVMGTVFYPRWKLRSGFKVDLGVYLPHDGWDLVAEYTWFYNKNNDFKSADFLSGQGVSLRTGSTLDSAKSRWNNFYNRIDATLARTFYAGHYLTIRPFLGVLGAWDDQKSNTECVTLVQSLPSNTEVEDLDQEWWGFGPYAGVCPSYIFPPADSQNQWSIFLNSGIALALARSENDAKTSTFNTANSSTTDDQPTTSLYSRSVYWGVDPMLELAIGLRWETWFETNWNFMLQAAWEHQIWLEHNKMSANKQDRIPRGNYSMNGLTIKALIGF